MQWETVIGLEVHVQLSTASKIFSGASTVFGAEANTQACAVDLGLPGVLPVVNKDAVRKAVSFGLAINAGIGKHSRFDRKNYFYPDLPKGYQISQMDHPIVQEGQISISLEDGSEKLVGVTRAHLEEDAGKSLHEDFHGQSGIDLNRAGTPLLEIVSEPDLRNAKEAVAYLRYIHALIQFLGISDGNMAQGSMRCDANVSVRPVGQEEFGTRCEIKNINSFRFVERAINHEVARQIDLIEDGGKVVQETRLYDADKDETRSMRSKEVANDYRYFPDPDLLPIEIDDQYIEAIRAQLPELPHQKVERYCTQLGLDKSDASQLCSSLAMAEFFEAALAISNNAKLTANWINSTLAGALNKAGLEIQQSPVSAAHLGQLVLRISDESINSKIAKKVFTFMCNADETAEPDAIIKREGLEPMKDDGAVEAMVDKVIQDNPEQVQQFLAGKDKVLGFFVGQIMKQSQGKANPGQVNQLLKAKLKRD